MPVCVSSGNCNLCDALHLISNLARWILGIVGASALLFFVYGGFLWITSAGVSSRVQQGQSIMVNTVIGIIIVVLAWTVVNFVIISFVNTGDAKTKFEFVGKSDAEWYQLCVGEKGKECEYLSDGTPCENRTMHCEAGKCESPNACVWLATVKKDSNYAGWACHTLTECKLNNYNDCNAPNCERNLCPEGINNVCCKP
ncbi:pilin [Candidatus Parcubacteria bacterium]|nr:pilin [Patescibacteria group bacterium]MBU4482310.1 pilin [Patescibacteria group bacterium]MCG2686860.1 pilin [Candidatus Parcubacteria bacterium]